MLWLNFRFRLLFGGEIQGGSKMSITTKVLLGLFIVVCIYLDIRKMRNSTKSSIISSLLFIALILICFLPIFMIAINY